VKITVVALGKLGLPLAVQYACRGHDVIGSDINGALVDRVNQGVVPFPGEADLAEKLASVVADGSFSATTDTTAAVSVADVVVVVVPLVVDPDGQPDFGPLDVATRQVGRGLRPGALVCYETTLPVGTTRTRLKPMLQHESNLVEGTDFHLVFSPERVMTGRVFADLKKYPKLVGGLSDVGAKLAAHFYDAVLEFDERLDLERANGVWDLGSADAAEMAKLAETTYRDVNIGLANHFAKFAAANGIDIYQVIEAANSQPYSHIHRPGIAVGGHCIPVYPRLYLWNDPAATVVSAAREINASMPAYAVSLAKEAYGDLACARVAVLGAAYRGGVKEVAFSGVFPLVEALAREGAVVAVHDPLYSAQELERLGLKPFELGHQVDLAIIHTDHLEYRRLKPSDLPGARLIVDGRLSLVGTTLGSADVIHIGVSRRTFGC
jgi:nucleotide sugar dehydrogenase